MNLRKVILSFVLLLFLTNAFAVSSPERISLSGNVKDETSGEALIGVIVSIKGLKSGAITNSYGFYSVSVLSSRAIVSRGNTKKDGFGRLVAGLPQDENRAAAGDTLNFHRTTII